MNEAQQRIREILQKNLKHAGDIVALMEERKIFTRDEREVDTTARSIADRKIEIEGLKEALRQMDLL